MQDTPTKTADEGELKALRRTSLVTRRSSSVNAGELAALAQTPPPKSTPITDEEAEVLEKAKEAREMEHEKEQFEKSIEKAERRKSRRSEAEVEVAKADVDVKKIIARRSSVELNPPREEPEEPAEDKVSRRSHW